MIENYAPGGSLLAPPTPDQRNQQRIVYESDQGPPRRNNRNRRSPKGTNAPLDGSISDSIAISNASPRSKKVSQPRTQALVNHSGKKQRPAAYNGNGVPATPAKEQAYAGSTFQASPAASALPMPKLFARPASTTNGAPSGRPASAKSLESKSVSPQQRPASAISPPAQPARNSPLDIFFEADRVERGKSRTQSDSLSARPFHHAELAFNPARNADHRKLDQQASPQQPSLSPQQSQSVQQQDQLTRSLKDLLFNTASSQAPATPPFDTTPPPRSQHGIGNISPSPFLGQRSGPTTPLPGPDHRTDSSLHYGNRNLSPLFQAARDETPSRPSHLRREVSHDGTVIPPTSPSHSRNSATIDPHIFSRQYLNQQITNSHYPPPLPPTIPTSYSSGSSASGPLPFSRLPQPTTSWSEPPPFVSENQAPPRPAVVGGDVRSMEEDLRRMLNLNGISK